MPGEPEDTTELRCAGLIFADSRPITPNERDELIAQGRRCRIRAGLCLLAIPLGLGLIVSLAYLLPRTDVAAIAVGSLGAAYLLLGTAIFLSLAFDRFRWARGLRRDAAEGTVHGFVGVAPLDAPFDPTLRALRKQRYLLPDASRKRRIEVLAASSLVWSVDGVRPSSWIAALVAQTARTPAAASVAARWVRPVAVPGGRVAMLNRRELSSEEIAELRAIVRRGLPRIVVTGLLLVFLIAQTAARLRETDRAPLALVMAGVTVFLAIRIVRDFEARWKFRKDAAAGRVVIVRGEPVPVPDGESVPGPTVELLPASKLPWTRNGQPMPWRTLGSASANRLIPSSRDKAL